MPHSVGFLRTMLLYNLKAKVFRIDKCMAPKFTRSLRNTHNNMGKLVSSCGPKNLKTDWISKARGPSERGLGLGHVGVRRTH